MKVVVSGLYELQISISLHNQENNYQFSFEFDRKKNHKNSFLEVVVQPVIAEDSTYLSNSTENSITISMNTQ